MGENKKVKLRKCHSCDTAFSVDAETLWRHAKLCSEGKRTQERLAAIGLVSPEKQDPKLTIKRLSNE